ncbi:uncharacterized protein LOC122048400 [Zingiber officinale]|uniref:uncharacterized protein LOC122048400 n=1 Tax=Zingiber officinale TaxID=94328 RepID=UPI001C4AFDEF|nr:uncharacterized protein LOC122048400 [Zingiber officinale]
MKKLLRARSTPCSDDLETLPLPEIRSPLLRRSRSHPISGSPIDLIRLRLCLLQHLDFTSHFLAFLHSFHPSPYANRFDLGFQSQRIVLGFLKGQSSGDDDAKVSSYVILHSMFAAAELRSDKAMLQNWVYHSEPDGETPQPELEQDVKEQCMKLGAADSPKFLKNDQNYT